MTEKAAEYVREKLRDFGLSPEDVERVISEVIDFPAETPEEMAVVASVVQGAVHVRISVMKQETKELKEQTERMRKEYEMLLLDPHTATKH
jgi:uncharacterized membrane protein